MANYTTIDGSGKKSLQTTINVSSRWCSSDGLKFSTIVPTIVSLFWPMIYHGNHETITFVPKMLSSVQAALQKTGPAQCDRVSLYRYNAVLSDVKDQFQESEAIQIITGLDSSVTAANVFCNGPIISFFMCYTEYNLHCM